MTETLIFIFCVSAFALVHSYLLYPLLLSVFAKRKKPNELVYKDTDELPSTFILMSAYNEEQVIEEKMSSMLESDYPTEKLFFYIGSDASSDRTDDMMRDFEAQNQQVRFYRYEDRGGKSNVINKLHDQILQDNVLEQGSIFILTDANVLFTRSTVIALVRHFRNPNIGQVGAQIINKGMKSTGISYQEQFYINRENKIKNDEGRLWGTMMGAFGACYAMRADLFKVIPPNYLMEDFYLSMHVLEQGKKAIHEMKAICYEDLPDDVRIEYQRKRRISAGNYQNLSSYKSLLWPPTSALGFSFLSHKVLRWFGPFFLLLSMLSSFLLGLQSKVFLGLFLLLVGVMITPVIERILQKVGIHSIVLRFISYFVYMNLALLEGFFVYLKGVRTNVWQPTTRSNE